MTTNDICKVISRTLGISLSDSLPLNRVKITLPNFATAHLSINVNHDNDTVHVLIEKDSHSMQCVVAHDASMIDRIREFVSAWKTVGMSGVALISQSSISNGVKDAATISETGNIQSGRHSTMVPEVFRQIEMGPIIKGVRSDLRDPFELEKNGNLIGLNHPMFKPKDELDTNLPFSGGLGDFSDPLQGVKRPKHLPPNAQWERARPDTRDPLASRSGLPYI